MHSSLPPGFRHTQGQGASRDYWLPGFSTPVAEHQKKEYRIKGSTIKHRATVEKHTRMIMRQIIDNGAISTIEISRKLGRRSNGIRRIMESISLAYPIYDYKKSNITYYALNWDFVRNPEELKRRFA